MLQSPTDEKLDDSRIIAVHPSHPAIDFDGINALTTTTNTLASKVQDLDEETNIAITRSLAFWLAFASLMLATFVSAMDVVRSNFRLPER